MRFRHALIALAAALAAGCSTTVAGTAVPVDRDPLAGSTFFGDQRTVDWCSLVSLDPIKKYGVPERPSNEGFDNCYVYVTTDAEHGFGLSVGAPDDVYPEDGTFDVRKLPSGLQVTTVLDEDDFCRKLLRLSDGVRVQVMAAALVGDPATDICDPVDAVLAGLAERVTSGQVARHHRVPTATLRTADACAATPEETATGVPGLARVEAASVPLAHLCVWEDTGRTQGPLLIVSLDLEFGLGDDPELRREQVDGQEVFLVEDAEEGFCTAIAVVRPVPGAADEAEVVEAFLDPGAAGSASTCADAARVALATRKALLG
ncbi:hypothetical protein UO65_4547 [Actinokineospora spheciospongiae]|uniref:DUF3558 domain-containing protein n=1 Tax=Actinokineospora spheciospongiae TaxID=909613 RepID=W7ITQ3_9PSEU|nr:hypothetical protein [Actinokineospora spheciospongiae]EWC60107.1 hypothetical protein UO65_4547 [Actinokineospora spheciospongiae]